MSREKMRIKIRKYADSQFKILVFNQEEETLASLMEKIQTKLYLPTSYQTLILEGGGKIEDVNEIVFDDKVEIIDDTPSQQPALNNHQNS
ncbi:UNKNOWN [Stylonychia lemnae]|uniref:Ubiquitin-like domain-containing protein n=1 Tax=Stylonychia lemnae TaxID=5949 RepID=A0A078B3E7_STYLE|nr:UNKNOWN [Stylonychia lemnae]|eukprot:CDW88028.1 UNKNOWN [Stylonychia lemnae]